MYIPGKILVCPSLCYWVPAGIPNRLLSKDSGNSIYYLSYHSIYNTRTEYHLDYWKKSVPDFATIDAYYLPNPTGRVRDIRIEFCGYGGSVHHTNIGKILYPKEQP